MKNYCILIVIYCVLLPVLVFGGQTTYYSPSGKIVTEEEFKKIINKKDRELVVVSNDILPYSVKEKAFFSPDNKEISENLYNELVNAHRKKVHESSLKLSNIKLYDEFGNPTNDSKYLDEKGRPIYNSNGGRFVYEEEEANLRANSKWKPKPGSYVFFSSQGDMNREKTIRFSKQKDGSLMPYETYQDGSVRIPIRVGQ